MTKLKLTIQGMHCASCAGNIERSLKKVHGIKDVTVSVMTKKGFVETDKEVNEEELKKAILRAGNYKLLAIEKE